VSSRTELDSDPPLWTLFANRHIIDVELGTLKTSPTLSEHELAAGDLLIVCSDGVSDNLTGTEMAALVRSAASAGPQEVAQALAVAAQTRAQSQHLRAKPDDISAACLQA
jgi:serine/threonine protein phosphatase PrpC